MLSLLGSDDDHFVTSEYLTLQHQNFYYFRHPAIIKKKAKLDKIMQ